MFCYRIALGNCIEQGGFRPQMVSPGGPMCGIHGENAEPLRAGWRAAEARSRAKCGDGTEESAAFRRLRRRSGSAAK
jgi:hypothetical protein